MTLPIDFNRPVYNAVNIRIKKPEVNAGAANDKNSTDPITVNRDNGIYNAVKIRIDNPKVNTEPQKVYNYPDAEELVTYEMLNIQPVALNAPAEPESNDTNNDVEPQEETGGNITEVPAPNYTTLEEEKIDLPEEKKNNSITALSFRGENPTVKKPEIIPSENILPKIDISKVAENLSSKDRDIQARQIEEIVRTAIVDKDTAKHYLVSDVFTELIKITEEDATKLQPPTQKQVEIRQKLIADIIAAERDKVSPEKLPYKLSEEEINIATVLSPMELAERNKEYAITTLGVLAELFIEDYKEKEGRVVPITDAPGVSAIVNALRKDPDSAIKLASLDALRQIQRPEYKEELSALYAMAKTDPDPNVSRAASVLLTGIEKI